MSMPIPQWVIGRAVSNLSINIQTEVNGVFTPTSTLMLNGQLESIMLRFQPEELEISPLDATTTNDVILKDSVTLELTELLQTTAPASGNQNVLAAFVASGNQVGFFTVTRGGKTWSFYGRRSTYSDGGDKGVWKSTLMVKMVNFEPTYT